LISPIIGKDN